MAFEAGICPKCKEYLLVKSNVPFLVCPMCGQSISNREAITRLSARCHDKDAINDLIADCIALEMQYGPELPFMILGKINENFPQLESPAYMMVRMTGYTASSVHYYLKTFAGIKSNPSNVPWAEEFLDCCLNYRNMEFADLFVAYVENKVRKEKQDEYRNKIAKLRQEYTFKASNPSSTKWLLALYIGAALLNVLLFPCFMLLSGWLSTISTMYYAANIGIAVLAICSEVGLLFLHNKIYGNRLGMSDLERICMVIFLSSMVFAIGAAVMGSIWMIKL